jgi:hypothetical protein
VTTTRRTRRPAQTPATPPPAKKTPELHPCGCGCGEQTPRRFRPGHDARVPLGATCQPASGTCDQTATFALGKVPVCDTHLAGRVRENDGGRVRLLQAPVAATNAA